MIDVQSVYIRDFIRLSNVAAIVLVRVLARTPLRATQLRKVTQVRVGGSPTSFFVASNGDLLANAPSDVFVSTGSLFSINKPGIPTDLEITWTGDDGLPVVEKVNQADVQLDNNCLRVQGQDFTNAVQVLLNRQPVDFVVLSKNYLVCSHSPDLETVDSLEVVASSARITGTSFFSYFLGEPIRTVSGIEKLTGQFIKLLLTSRGTDTFNPDLGGDLQKWVSSTTDPEGSVAFSQILSKVVTLGANMTAGQVVSNLPPEETLAFVEVVDIQFNPADPTEIELSIRLRNLAGQLAAVNVLVGQVASAIQTASAGVGNA